MNRLFQSGGSWFYQARRKLATAAMCALLGWFGYHAVFGANGFLALHQKQTESRQLEQEIRSLQQDNARSEQQIKALKSDPQAIENEARVHLHYAREGEKIYKLPAVSPTPKNPQ
jgi:cell division protein FtsB